MSNNLWARLEIPVGTNVVSEDEARDEDITKKSSKTTASDQLEQKFYRMEIHGVK